MVKNRSSQFCPAPEQVMQSMYLHVNLIKFYVLFLLQYVLQLQYLNCFVHQVLASYINPAGSSNCHSADSSSADNRAQNSSALPAVLQELLSQSCLIPAMSSYLRNDSGRLPVFTSDRYDTQSKKRGSTSSRYKFEPCILHWVPLVCLGEMLQNFMYFSRIEQSQNMR